MSEDDVTATGSTQAEVRLPSRDLHADLSFYGETLGFRLESIFPADDPAVAVMTGHGLRIRLDRGADEAPGTIRMLCDRPESFASGRGEIEAPNGTRIEICPREPELARPSTRHELIVRRMGERESWVVGRAGMQYRDLIPGRLGGAVIASHIRIPHGGPVPDMVHYHAVAFQLIYCRRGWFDLVYEDQGPPFRLEAGDCVIQPPRIRHRVLESSDNGEVIELGVPAEHLTTIDHELALPTGTLDPQREFGGQRFCRHRRRDAAWDAWRLPGFEARRTGIDDATGGVAMSRWPETRRCRRGIRATTRDTSSPSPGRGMSSGRRLEAQDLRAGMPRGSARTTSREHCTRIWSCSGLVAGIPDYVAPRGREAASCLCQGF